MIENRKSTETVKQWQWWTAVQRSGCRQSWPSSLSDEVPSAYRACQRSQRWKGVHSQRSVRSRTGFENIGENSPCLQMSSASHALHLPSRWWSTCYQRYPEISRWDFPWTSPHELGHCGFFGAKVTRLGTSCRARQGWVAIEWASCLGGGPKQTEKSWRFVSKISEGPFLVQWKDVKNIQKLLQKIPDARGIGIRVEMVEMMKMIIAGRGLLTDPLGKLHGMQCALVAGDGDLSLRLGIRCGCLQVSCSKTRFEAHLF